MIRNYQFRGVRKICIHCNFCQLYLLKWIKHTHTYFSYSLNLDMTKSTSELQPMSRNVSTLLASYTASGNHKQKRLNIESYGWSCSRLIIIGSAINIISMCTTPYNTMLFFGSRVVFELILINATQTIADSFVIG